jgi:hypothetical protein
MPYPETESYRLKILGADLLGLGLTLGSRMLVEDDTPALLGLASWIALSPIVHCMNGNNRSAGISLTMRLTLPIVTEKPFSPVHFVVLPTQEGLQMAMAGRF